MGYGIDDIAMYKNWGFRRETMSMIGLISRLFECLADSWDDHIILVPIFGLSFL